MKCHSHSATRIVALLFLVVLGSPLVSPRDHGDVRAEEGTTELDEAAYDPDNGEEINEICAACHGEYGQGGADGTYPRLAGLSARYIAKQLRAFKSRERMNIPMMPYATERELPEEDVRDIAIFLSRIKLHSAMPDFDEETTSYEKLLTAKRVFNVAAVEGHAVRGRALYTKTCKKCHGADAAGRGKNPPLAGQYTNYLRRQIDLFLSGERAHKSVDKIMRPRTDEDWTHLFAYLSRIDD